MNRIMPLVALTVSALLVGCSAASDEGKPQVSASSPAAVTASSNSPASQASASSRSGQTAMALAISDLPYGWATSPPSTGSSVTSPCSAINADATAHLPNQTEVDFQASEDGPFLQEILVSGSADQAQAAFTAVQKAPGLCAASTHLTPTPFQSFGDASYALALTATRVGVNFSGDVVVIRKGRTFLEVVMFVEGGVPTSLVQQMAAKAVGKLGS